MIDVGKVNAEELADIVDDVQRKVCFHFDFMDLHELMMHTIRKVELNGRDESYIPILLRNELEDFVMRKRINERGRVINVRDLYAEPVSSQVS